FPANKCQNSFAANPRTSVRPAGRSGKAPEQTRVLRKARCWFLYFCSLKKERKSPKRVPFGSIWFHWPVGRLGRTNGALRSPPCLRRPCPALTPCLGVEIERGRFCDGIREPYGRHKRSFGWV